MISVIVPVYNNARYLDKCIQSVVSQSFRDIEVILVDDGSTDDSGKICDNWSAVDNRVKVLHEKNGGVSSARNKGIIKACGEYVLFLDSDDALDRNTCLKLFDYAKANNADCVIFGFIQATGTVWAPGNYRLYASQMEFKKDFTMWLNTELLSPAVNKLYKKQSISCLFPEGISFGEDLIFSLNYIKHCERICFVPWPLYLHNNINDSSLTHTLRRDQILEIEYWQNEIIRFIDGKAISMDLYEKYLKDTLLWLKRFYAYQEITIKDKKSFLRRWYKNSHLKGLSLMNQLGMVYMFIMVCLKLHLWLLPSRILNIKHIITGKRKCL